jgi:hypothetical protein
LREEREGRKGGIRTVAAALQVSSREQ